jgi:dTDP-4-dehydrorhamnose 3,5-epimerase
MKLLRELHLAGVVELHLFRHQDERGVFVKPWHLSSLETLGIAFEVRECFWSVSQRGNIRGMHFQSPPNGQCKLVICQKGKILDVLLDLRPHSPTYGQNTALELTAEQANAVYLPVGIAHGFQCLSKQCQVLYFTNHEHVPERDHGFLWNSFGFDWPLKPTQISDRDQKLPSFRSQ